MVALLAFVGGAVGVFEATVALMTSLLVFLGLLGSTPPNESMVVVGILGMILSVFQLRLGVGAWMRDPASWDYGRVLQVVLVLFGLARIIGRGSLLAILPFVLVPGAILYYLYTPEVRQAFRRV